VKKIAIIGGGASGMMAAITAAQCGAQVTIFEKNERIGKKILATGNGKCNYSNRDFCVEYYYGTYRDMLPQLFEQFSVTDAVSFFQEAGMLSKERNGYLYPLSEQASTVLDILRLKLKRLGVRAEVSTEVKSLQRSSKDGMFVIKTEGKTEKFHSAVLACGGCAAPKTGSDGSGYRLAAGMGHHLINTVPALVQLKCREDLFKMVAGVRCDASLKLDSETSPIQEERGEVQFTDYGISGIPVFQLSRTAAYMLKEKKEVPVYIDFFPDCKDEEYEELSRMRIDDSEGKSAEEFLLGMANKKINMVMLKLKGIKPSEESERIGKETLKELLYSYRRLCVHVISTNSFENAQVSAGGVDMREVTLQMESSFVPGLYFAGELLDVDGRCGGYNLQWAWTSGYIAGKNAADKGYKDDSY
jgi:predicted Rossmann fold flavoprotein